MIEKEYPQEDPNLKSLKNTTQTDLENTLWIEIEERYPKSIYNNEFKELQEVVNSAFWINMPEKDVKDHIFKSDLVFLVKVNWKIVGFSSIINFNWLIYRFWTAINKEYQWKWLYQKLTENIWLNWIYFLRTQNKNIINSLKNMWLKVLVWKKAQDFLLNNWYKISNLKEFFILLDWWKDYLDKWCFKWVYGGPLWKDNTVNFITDDDYQWFNHQEWDALLVIYHNE